MAFTALPHIRLPFFHSTNKSLLPFSFLPPRTISFSIQATQMSGSEITETEQVGKKVFVAGATGNTGKRIVEQLLAKGFAVKAGVRDVDKAKSTFSDNPALQIVKADVTEGVDQLAEAIGNDSDAVVCATGFKPSLDLLAPWKAENHIRKSGIDYTIVRPGGLKNDPPSGNIIMEPEDTLSKGSISRDQVAEVAVKALILPEAAFKVVEIVATAEVPKRPLKELYASISQK